MAAAVPPVEAPFKPTGTQAPSYAPSHTPILPLPASPTPACHLPACLPVGLHALGGEPPPQQRPATPIQLLSPASPLALATLRPSRRGRCRHECLIVIAAVQHNHLCLAGLLGRPAPCLLQLAARGILLLRRQLLALIPLVLLLLLLCMGLLALHLLLLLRSCCRGTTAIAAAATSAFPKSRLPGLQQRGQQGSTVELCFLWPKQSSKLPLSGRPLSCQLAQLVICGVGGDGKKQGMSARGAVHSCREQRGRETSGQRSKRHEGHPSCLLACAVQHLAADLDSTAALNLSLYFIQAESPKHCVRSPVSTAPAIVPCSAASCCRAASSAPAAGAAAAWAAARLCAASAAADRGSCCCCCCWCCCATSCRPPPRAASCWLRSRCSAASAPAAGLWAGEPAWLLLLVVAGMHTRTLPCRGEGRAG